MIDLGYANGWGKNAPKEVIDCEIDTKKNGQHKWEVVNAGRCVTKYTCLTCGYTYKVDSSD
jgi:hypothetical protein